MYGKIGYWKDKKMPKEARANMSKGAMGKVLSKETRAKMSKARKGKQAGKDNPMYGYEWSEEQLQHLSEINSGENNAFFGKKHSDESKEKMRLWHKSNPHAKGENNPRSKLSKEQAIAIFHQVKELPRQEWPDLSRYNVAESTIYSIKSERHWAIKEYLNK